MPAQNQRELSERLDQRRPVSAGHHGPGLDSLQYSSIAVVVGWQKTPPQALAPPYTSAYFSYNCPLSNVLIEGFGIPLPSFGGPGSILGSFLFTHFFDDFLERLDLADFLRPEPLKV